MATGDLGHTMTCGQSRSITQTINNTQTCWRKSSFSQHMVVRLDLFNSTSVFQILFILTLTLLQGVEGQFSCRQPGYNEIVPWRLQPSRTNVTWRLDQVCSGTIQCYGQISTTQDQPLHAQLCPVQIQAGDSLYLLPPPVGSPYTTTVVNVTEAAFYVCPSRAYPPDQILQNFDRSQPLEVSQRFLTTGVLYLAQHPDGTFSNCNFGLRLKVLVKSQLCTTSSGSDTLLCSGRGVCGSKFLEESYRCFCFENYRGMYCAEFDACASLPCRNGAKCIDGEQGLLGSNFICICAEGFTGPDCTEIIGQCALRICGNGSCVAVSRIAFKCECRAGFSGTFCDHFTNMCALDPCLNQGTCVTQFQTYVCQCQLGFTGQNCETNIDECASNPCAEAATCIDNTNGFYCHCPPGFDSGLCFEPINFCTSSPCENNGNCIPIINGFLCNCTLGFHGDRCESIIARCSQDPDICRHGGHCLQSSGGPVQCQCSPGWTGPTCEQLDNLCRFNPCPNRTVCIDTSSMLRPGTYECSCPPGYTGGKCESEVEECLSSPCANGGVCVDRLAGYSCICPQGYRGTHCETDIDMCDGRGAILCLNGATCLDGDTGFQYSCTCAPGFTSADCSISVNECSSSPCMYNGTCTDRLNGYTCHCQDGFSGQNCQIYFNYCRLQACENGARCVPRLGSYSCICTPGWTGSNCTHNVDECASTPCMNGATCQDGIDQYKCVCGGDYYGTRCESNIDNCVQDICLNGATCQDKVDDFECICRPGYVGKDCGTNVACLSSPCRNGFCSQDDFVGGYNCVCDTRLWAGVNCEIPLNNCSSSPCQNDAVCHPTPRSDYTCECQPRYVGKQCETLVELCTLGRCANGGTCTEDVPSLTYRCTCPVGYYGAHCQNDKDYCINNGCLNGATCQDGNTGYKCACTPGFTGDVCETDIDDCASTPCKNLALCIDKTNGYECFCSNGYSGDQCTEEVDECQSSPCLNAGICMDLVNSFRCICTKGFTGPRCDANRDNCIGHACKNGATCIDGVNKYSCQCPEGFVGSDCSFEINECLSSPCDPHGAVLCNDGLARYTCVCKEGFAGTNCEKEVNECASNPCRNGGLCQDLLNGYSCTCREATTGTDCETVIDHCASNPCGTGQCEQTPERYSCVCPNDDREYDANCKVLLPCRSAPCRNGGVCVNDRARYRCLCRPGFTGDNCDKADFCRVYAVNCNNGGLCVNLEGNFTCVCTAGFSGRYCDVNKNECETHVCQNGAKCEDLINNYRCQCSPGYAGRYCENYATTCVEQPCRNGASCFSTPNFIAQTLYTCVCVVGYEGSYCERESDECSSVPCQNGGTCQEGAGFFQCTCALGWTGTTCEINVDECLDHACLNGATCVDGVNGYSCQCATGFTGRFCQSELNECMSSPCLNGGRCVDGNKEYQCFCRNGFTGVHCEVDYNECLSDPCLNGATCINYVATIACQCPLGVTGTLCETNIDECSSSPCRNGATCTDLLSGYNCTCPLGYTGIQCETDVDECGSDPCQNGGTCRDRIGMYVCDCVQPYRGVSCNLLPCDLNPCESGGTCYNDFNTLPDGFRCECIKGLSGTRCQSNIDDCVMTDGAVPCSGRGLCLDDINKYTCLCQPGWKGHDCEVPIDECANNKCRNKATCINLWMGYRCNCLAGFEGTFCERDTDECAPNRCNNGATCVDLQNDYRCMCKEGWTGKDCDTEVNECRVSMRTPCLNGGTCIDGFASFTCQCPAFYTGRLCEVRYDPCDNAHYPCLQEALCRTKPDGSYRCLCPTGYIGTNCEIDVDECRSNPCHNSGRCEDRAAGYLCYCRLGFSGVHCETNIDNCLYCMNGASCTDLINGYECTCPAAFRGINCTEDVDECDVTAPCMNGGTCSNSFGGYECVCKPGYTGGECETDIDECASNPCENGALCNQGFDNFLCFCRLGYTGPTCAVNIDDCVPHPCGNGRCTDLVNGHLCTCNPGWTGRNCSVNYNECAPDPCNNGALCVDRINTFRCICLQGYTGARCEFDMEVCAKNDVSQCLNGGTCSEGPGTRFDCICKPGYTGTYCELDVNECQSVPCKNGAGCEDRPNGYSCTCAPGFTGADCSTDIDECESSPCMNGGFCQQRTGDQGYECLCRSGLGGLHCEINYDDCLSSACLNGGVCIDGRNQYTCVCPSHTTGQFCQNFLFTPSPTIKPTTGVVSSTGVSIADSSSVLLGTIVMSSSTSITLSSTVPTSMVVDVDDSVPLVTRTPPSDSFISGSLSQTTFVGMDTDSSSMVSMTTSIAALESSSMDIASTKTVDDSLDMRISMVTSFVLTSIFPTSSIHYSPVILGTDSLERMSSLVHSSSITNMMTTSQAYAPILTTMYDIDAIMPSSTSSTPLHATSFETSLPVLETFILEPTPTMHTESLDLDIGRLKITGTSVFSSYLTLPSFSGDGGLNKSNMTDILNTGSMVNSAASDVLQTPYLTLTLIALSVTPSEVTQTSTFSETGSTTGLYTEEMIITNTPYTSRRGLTSDILQSSLPYEIPGDMTHMLMPSMYTSAISLGISSLSTVSSTIGDLISTESIIYDSTSVHRTHDYVSSVQSGSTQPASSATISISSLFSVSSLYVTPELRNFTQSDIFESTLMYKTDNPTSLVQSELSHQSSMFTSTADTSLLSLSSGDDSISTANTESHAMMSETVTAVDVSATQLLASSELSIRPSSVHTKEVLPTKSIELTLSDDVASPLLSLVAVSTTSLPSLPSDIISSPILKTLESTPMDIFSTSFLRSSSESTEALEILTMSSIDMSSEQASSIKMSATSTQPGVTSVSMLSSDMHSLSSTLSLGGLKSILSITSHSSDSLEIATQSSTFSSTELAWSSQLQSNMHASSVLLLSDLTTTLDVLAPSLDISNSDFASMDLSTSINVVPITLSNDVLKKSSTHLLPPSSIDIYPTFVTSSPFTNVVAVTDIETSPIVKSAITISNLDSSSFTNTQTLHVFSSEMESSSSKPDLPSSIASSIATDVMEPSTVHVDISPSASSLSLPAVALTISSSVQQTTVIPSITSDLTQEYYSDFIANELSSLYIERLTSFFTDLISSSSGIFSVASSIYDHSLTTAFSLPSSTISATGSVGITDLVSDSTASELPVATSIDIGQTSDRPIETLGPSLTSLLAEDGHTTLLTSIMPSIPEPSLTMDTTVGSVDGESTTDQLGTISLDLIGTTTNVELGPSSIQFEVTATGSGPNASIPVVSSQVRSLNLYLESSSMPSTLATVDLEPTSVVVVGISSTDLGDQSSQIMDQSSLLQSNSTKDLSTAMIQSSPQDQSTSRLDESLATVIQSSIPLQPSHTIDEPFVTMIKSSPSTPLASDTIPGTGTIIGDASSSMELSIISRTLATSIIPKTDGLESVMSSSIVTGKISTQASSAVSQETLSLSSESKTSSLLSVTPTVQPSGAIPDTSSFEASSQESTSGGDSSSMITGIDFSSELPDETTLLISEPTPTNTVPQTSEVIDSLQPSLSSSVSDASQIITSISAIMTVTTSGLLPSQILSSSLLSSTLPITVLPTRVISSSPATTTAFPMPVSLVTEAEVPVTTQNVSPTATSITVPDPIVMEVETSGDSSMMQTAIISATTTTTQTSTTRTSRPITPSSTASRPITPSPTKSLTTMPTVTTPEPEYASCLDRPCYGESICRDVLLLNGTGSYVCQCTEKYMGQRCNHPRVFDPLKFTGSSLLTFDPVPLRSENIIQLTLRTYQRDGVIFYSARDYSVSDSTHYIRLLIKDGMLVYEFSCIVESFWLESNVRVDTGGIFNITIRQSSDCKAQMDVDWDDSNISVKMGSPFVFESLYLTALSTLYVGGVPSHISYIPAPAPNFAGCLGVPKINGEDYGFFQARKAVNIAECGVTIPTVSSATTTTTSSPQPSCDDVTCQNGGTCQEIFPSRGATWYRCDCPLHFAGKHCEQEIGISFPSFSGQSYLKHPDLDFSKQPSNDLYVTFKTSSDNGTLLYATSRSGEFVHLFIEGGFLKYQVSCGPINVLFVDTRVLVNHDNLTAVSIRQTEETNADFTVTVTINDNVHTTVTLSLSPPQKHRSYDLVPLYLGGLPLGVRPAPRATPFVNFVGCIRHLQINGEERLVFQDAVEGRNIRECDVPPCDFTPCYNNATCIPSVGGYTCECISSYSGALCERTACDRNPCEHGGTCIHQPRAGDYACLCPYGRHGVNCERTLAISRPEYYGTQLGYISFTAYPPVLGLDYIFDIRFSFTVNNIHANYDGVMLFAGQEAANPKYGADFFAVGIRNGYIHFQYNLGSGMAHIRSLLPVNASSATFHQVRVGRDRRNGYLGLDSQRNATGRSGGSLQGLNIFSDLFVGGYDNYNMRLPDDVIFKNGFKGCLFDLVMRTGSNGHWRAPGRVLTGRNVGQCQRPECDVRDCHNGATCVDLGATHRCECTAGWKGPTCSDVITPCDINHNCANGATCLPLAAGGYTCHCPLGTAGFRCKQGIIITDARFVGETSYMGFSHKGTLRFAIDIRLQFKPEVSTGLLLYVAEHMSMRSGDFLSIVLQDNRVQLRYRVGTSPTVVVTSQNTFNLLKTDMWHVVDAGRNTTHGYMTLNGMTTYIKVVSQMVGLDVTTPLYIGGVPELSTLAPSAIQDEPSAFQGCVRELIVNKHTYQLTAKGADSGVNVVDCDGSLCGYQVCKNGGTCSENRITGFYCECTPEYFGLHCETSVLCRNKPCEGESTCIPNEPNSTYTCICPLGKLGTRCQEDFRFSAAQFNGDGYILYNDPAYNDSDVTKTYISFNFSTTASSGLIMWNGQAYSDKDDYLGVGMHRGHARIVISLGWWTREDVITDERVDDGQWHSLIIQRWNRDLRVYVDGNPYKVNLAGLFDGLNTGGGYYLGGFEHYKTIREETCSHFTSAFIGCLQDVHLHPDTAPLNLLNKASSGANVHSCDGR